MRIFNFKNVLYIAFILVSIIHIISIKNDNRTCRFVTKTFLVPMLLVIYLINANVPNLSLILALVFGFLGDVFLISSDKKFFVMGLFSFLIGHIFYCITFLKDIYFFSIPFYVVFLLLAYIVCGIWIYQKICPNIESIKKPVLLYCIVIISMSFLSLMRISIVRGYRFWMPFLGSMLFILSDTMLAYNKFIEKNKVRGMFVMITYILAQTLIVLGYI